MQRSTSLVSHLLNNLPAIRHRARQIIGAMQETEARLPDGISGTNRTAAVSVQISRSGMPVRIAVNEDWEQSVAANELGAAVLEAAVSAAAARTDALGALFRQAPVEAEEQATVIVIPDLGHPATAQVTGLTQAEPTQAEPPQRDLDDLVESILRRLETVRLAPDALAAPLLGMGTAADGLVQVRMGPAQLVSCMIDEEWATQRSAIQINVALAEALDRARDDLQVTTEESDQARTTRRLDDLFGYALAHLHEPTPHTSDVDTERTDDV